MNYKKLLVVAAVAAIMSPFHAVFAADLEGGVPALSGWESFSAFDDGWNSYTNFNDGWAPYSGYDNGWESYTNYNDGWNSYSNFDNGWDSYSGFDDGWNSYTNYDDGWNSYTGFNDGDERIIGEYGNERIIGEYGDERIIGEYGDVRYDSGCGCYEYVDYEDGYSYDSYGSTGYSRGYSYPSYTSSGYSSVRPMTFSAQSYPVYTPTYSAPQRPTTGGSSSVSNITNTTVTNVDNSINDSFNNYNSNNVSYVAPATPQYPVVYTTPTYQPSPYVSLSQIPYTGFDFGTFGNAAYWAGLLAFALGAGYLAVYYVPALAFANTRRTQFAPVVPAKAPILVEKEAIRSADGVQSIVNSVRKAGTTDTMAIVASKDGSMPKIVIARE